MIYQLVSHGWPLNGGATLLPAGTIIDTSQAEWSQLADVTPPPNAVPWDQPTYDRMRKFYEASAILTPPYSNIVRG
jgi:hypothetical protein